MKSIFVLCDRYALFSKVKQVLNIDNLKSFWRKRYQVHVCVYKAKQNGLLFCIGCCEAHRRREMNKKMEFDNFNAVTNFTTRLRHETKLLMEFSGLSITADYEEIHFLE